MLKKSAGILTVILGLALTAGCQNSETIKIEKDNSAQIEVAADGQEAPVVGAVFANAPDKDNKETAEAEADQAEKQDEAAQAEAKDESKEDKADEAVKTTSEADPASEDKKDAGKNKTDGKTAGKDEKTAETTVEVSTDSPYTGLKALAQVENYVNVRSGPSTDNDVVGKIYNNCAADIEGSAEGEDGTWFLISSGNCEGFIKAEYFLVGEAAEAKREEVGVLMGTVNVEALNVRSEPNQDDPDNIFTLYQYGTEVFIDEMTDDGWAKITTDAASTGYVYGECMDIRRVFKTAITIEEEEEELKRQAEAEAAAKEAEEKFLAAMQEQREAESLYWAAQESSMLESQSAEESYWASLEADRQSSESAEQSSYWASVWYDQSAQMSLAEASASESEEAARSASEAASQSESAYWASVWESQEAARISAEEESSRQAAASSEAESAYWASVWQSQEADRIAAEQESSRQAEEAYQASVRASQEADRIAAEQAASRSAEEAYWASVWQSQEADRIAAEEASRQAETAAAATQPAETQPEPTAPQVVDTNAALREAVCAYALQFVGRPYVHCGRSLTNGTDCSGFTSLVYQHFAQYIGYTLSYAPEGQQYQGTLVANAPVSMDQLLPGDILFFPSSYKAVGHVAIYLGNNTLIHAANEAKGICLETFTSYRPPLFARRIIN